MLSFHDVVDAEWRVLTKKQMFFVTFVGKVVVCGEFCVTLTPNIFIIGTYAFFR